YRYGDVRAMCHEAYIRVEQYYFAVVLLRKFKCFRKYKSAFVHKHCIRLKDIDAFFCSIVEFLHLQSPDGTLKNFCKFSFALQAYEIKFINHLYEALLPAQCVKHSAGITAPP